jgi:hypothetical protein
MDESVAWPSRLVRPHVLLRHEPATYPSRRTEQRAHAPTRSVSDPRRRRDQQPPAFALGLAMGHATARPSGVCGFAERIGSTSATYGNARSCRGTRSPVTRFRIAPMSRCARRGRAANLVSVRRGVDATCKSDNTIRIRPQLRAGLRDGGAVEAAIRRGGTHPDRDSTHLQR